VSGPSDRTKKKTDAELWDALRADAELEAVRAMSEDAVDAELRAGGADPEAIGRRGAALAEFMLAQHDQDWQTRAKDRQARMKKKAGDWPDFGAMPRPELMARVQAARGDARFASAPVVVAFRKRKNEEASEQELREILEEIEVLKRLADGAHDEGDEGSGGSGAP
jgi:hypothetical protein